MIKMYAPGKINLTLEVLNIRSDGYHEVRTILQTIDLADELIFSPNKNITLECYGHKMEDSENSVLKAAQALQTTTGCQKGAHIKLRKVIPVSSGLGGGSSDAAITLIALNRMWNLNLSIQELQPIARMLGSDTPFFLKGGTALAKGRGDDLEPLTSMPTRWLILLQSHDTLQTKTSRLYHLLGPEHWTNGYRTTSLQRALATGCFRDNLLFNIFEAVASQAFESHEHHQNVIRQSGGTSVHLAGSGPTLFTSTEDEGTATTIADKLRMAGHKVILTKTGRTQTSLG